MVDKIANIVSDYYDEDAAGRWRKCAQHIADSLTDEAATPGITGHQYRRARYEEPAATPQVSLKRMGLSDGRTDYFVMIKVGDREVSPHVFRDEYKAAYHVALYDWLLTGRGEKPEIVAFGPHDWPARPVDPAQPSGMREALQECIDVLALVEHPRREDPQYGVEVAALGDRIGYGALMSSASASWRKRLKEDGYPVGGEFVAGPCQATVTRALRMAREALTISSTEGK
jgi:hypothetical protein